MMKLAFFGYGKLGAAVERTARLFPDIDLRFGVTRRPPRSVKRSEDAVLPLLEAAELPDRLGEVDCLLLTGSSDADLPWQTPAFAEKICVVDAFDRHGKISEHIAAVDAAARQNSHTAVVCSGWDPGLFSVVRAFYAACFPYAKASTFWGRGISEGHSAAVRHICGVKDAVSFTLPFPRARLLANQGIVLPPAERHSREVCILPYHDADRERIAAQVRAMPDYFAGYKTDVRFFSEEEYAALPKEPSHRGEVTAVGWSGRFSAHRSSLSFSIETDSNPEFTASILLATAGAAYRMQKRGQYGAYTLLDVPPAALLPESFEKEKLF